MQTDPKDKKDRFENANKGAAVKPDEETLHTTDPQDKMKGPFSSPMQGISDVAKETDKVSKKEADEEKNAGN